jgi:signal transduction histidine kinase/FixJ family two-component response regulator
MNDITIVGLWRSAELKRSESIALSIGFAALLILLAATAANALFGIGENAAAPSIRDWLSSAVYILVAAIVALRAIRGSSKRWSWAVFALGLSLYALGNVLWSFWIGNVQHPPIPSICDGLWLTLYPLSYAAIVGFARVDGQRKVPAGVWLDGIIAGAGLAAIGSALVFGPVLASVSGSTAAIATELAYPIGDLVLGALVVGVLALRGWRIDRSWGLLGGGFLLLALADCMYAVQVASGSSHPTSMTNFFYVLAVALLALAAWQIEPERRRPWVEGWSVLLVPVGFTLAAVGLLLYDHVHRLDPLALGLAILTLLAAILRMGFAFVDLRSLWRERMASERDRAESERERRHLQERLQHSQRLESVGALAGGVAHDFNNLLAVILNYVSLVRDELPPSSQGRSDVDQIGLAAERGARLTEQLLAFGQRKTGDTEVLDVSEVILGMRTLLDRPLGSDIQLRYEPEEDVWPVQAARADLEQIVLNLVVNARDALATGGLITASAENVELMEGDAGGLDIRPGRYVRISVADDGCGIDVDTVTHVWEPFFTSKAPGDGTGLGLATVYGIARQAGGGVAISSTLGRGTRVDIYMPATEQSSPVRRELHTSPAQSCSGASVLLVADEPAVRDVVMRMLERAGYVVLVADRGDRALRLLAACERSCDLLLTDVIMPGMWGDELAKRAWRLVPDLPTLFMSGHSERFLRRGGALAPGPVLTKPFSEEVLLLQVATLIGARHSSGTQPVSAPADNRDRDDNALTPALSPGEGLQQRSSR